MQLVERHIIQRNHLHYQEIDALCVSAKNLYNYANFHIRQSFIFNNKYLDENFLSKQLKSSETYQALPDQVAQQVLLGLHRNWLSFFAAIKNYTEDNNKFIGRPKLPKYKHKEKGRHLLVYPAQAVSNANIQAGLIHLSQTHIYIPTSLDYSRLYQVRIVPKIDHYVVEVVYEKKELDYGLEPDFMAAIDLGIDNLATLTTNKPGFVPVLVKGRIIKSINRHYNQQKAQLQSLLPTHQKTSKRLQRLTKKRNFRLDDYLHKASRLIIDLMVKNRIGTLVIGQNPLYQQNANLGGKKQQDFVFIPYTRFVQQLSYKAKLVGIKILIAEVSYTSIASFLDQDPIPTEGETNAHQVKFSGQRIRTKLYRAGNGLLIHADVNGSLNILRKVIPTAFSRGIEGVIVRPVGVIPYKQTA
ncbi:transposase [Anabaena sp. UHCC 0451]|uniref:RNA-guided endonuclease InsQ/TnpB family protein n=1 Tax=Anabaena sp. UHCC 0451 TaxID=2055235 RepID=UPI002B2039EA|nr:transposase [Anabaena sp. UHCC 0451]MEA5577956.1 transposase [Anabaena sp. UHCC 0451]